MHRSLIALALSLATSVHFARAETPSATALAGTWGGADLVATFTESGAQLQAACGQGAIVGAVRPDRAGRFVATGAFQAFQAGPQRADEDIAPSPPATFAGRIHGDELRLSVRIPPGSAREYVLKRGAQPKLVRCL